MLVADILHNAEGVLVAVAAVGIVAAAAEADIHKIPEEPAGFAAEAAGIIHHTWPVAEAVGAEAVHRVRVHNHLAAAVAVDTADRRVAADHPADPDHILPAARSLRPHLRHRLHLHPVLQHKDDCYPWK